MSRTLEGAFFAFVSDRKKTTKKRNEGIVLRALVAKCDFVECNIIKSKIVPNAQIGGKTTTMRTKKEGASAEEVRRREG